MIVLNSLPKSKINQNQNQNQKSQGVRQFQNNTKIFNEITH